tara:strand:+ start:689 stop:901 length:213 start_codon:yes stop_codon:yes gene_type:complete
MKLTESNENRNFAEKIKKGRSVMNPLRQFIVTNFANIAAKVKGLLYFVIKGSGEYVFSGQVAARLGRSMG